MADSKLIEFVNAVIYDHGIATGLKSCKSDQDIVHFAQTQGFVFSQSHWDDFVNKDLSLLSSEELDLVSNTASDHWTWAFRRIKPWRDMLMPGA
tara:strand:- start:10 stop:291 length:282 start_codon:yes stop_codon:yes gene_type:complete